MSDIRIYDFEFNLLCIMTDIVSVQWHIRYNDIGSFEGHFRLKDSISDIILQNEYLIITQGKLQAVCTGKIVSDELVVCGRTVNWILTKRVRPPIRAKRIFGDYTDPETMLLYCLRKGFTEPPEIDENGEEIEESIDNNKKVTNFIIPESVGADSFDYHFWRLNAHNIETLAADLCKTMNRGHKMVFDIENRCWRFEFIFPSKKDMVFSECLKNIYDVTMSEDNQYKAGGGWYSSGENDEGEEDNSWYYTGSDDKQGIYSWDCVLDGSGRNEAESCLAKKKNTLSVNAKLIKHRYGEDYDIGDVVDVSVRYGNYDKKIQCLIVGVDIQYSQGSSYEEPVFEEYSD